MPLLCWWVWSLFRSNLRLGCNWLTCLLATLHLIRPSVISIWFFPRLHRITITFQTATAWKNSSFYSVTSFQVNVSALYIWKLWTPVSLFVYYTMIYASRYSLRPPYPLPVTWFHFISFGLWYNITLFVRLFLYALITCNVSFYFFFGYFLLL